MAQLADSFRLFSICPAMDTEIKVGPTGKKLLPLTVKKSGCPAGTWGLG
ncbi:Fe-S oxidoreductase [Streptomyces lividans 1326]|uniref:Fe-S oxidoreductase n=1 Tax=Streptomyces lividans 1326 TaxID=1200984 RepID=A0A7U9DPC0_STRLI|nr:Fe-S oxidoreductase [Streptomyces lividans 1326]